MFDRVLLYVCYKTRGTITDHASSKANRGGGGGEETIPIEGGPHVQKQIQGEHFCRGPGKHVTSRLA